jgi:hypothetical protein
VTRLVGFDVGTATGWALCEAGKIVESGVQRFDLARGESPGMRFLRFRRFVDELLLPAFGGLPLTGNVPQVVAFERAAFSRGGYAIELHNGFTTRLQEWAAAHGAESLPVNPGTLKKWATGSGRGDKGAMVRRASGIVGRSVGEDEADAILVALWAWQESGGK